MPEPHVGDPCPDVVLVASDPFRVGDLAALQFDGDADAAGHDDLDITAPSTVGCPGLYPGRESLFSRPSPQGLLAVRVVQAF